MEFKRKALAWHDQYTEIAELGYEFSKSERVRAIALSVCDILTTIGRQRLAQEVTSLFSHEL